MMKSFFKRTLYWGCFLMLLCALTGQLFGWRLPPSALPEPLWGLIRWANPFSPLVGARTAQGGALWAQALSAVGLLSVVWLGFQSARPRNLVGAMGWGPTIISLLCCALFLAAYARLLHPGTAWALPQAHIQSALSSLSLGGGRVSYASLLQWFLSVWFWAAHATQLRHALRKARGNRWE